MLMSEYKETPAGPGYPEGAVIVSRCCPTCDALTARLAAMERERDEALQVLKTMLVADLTRDRDLWIKTWAKVPTMTAGVLLNAARATDSADEVQE